MDNFGPATSLDLDSILGVEPLLEAPKSRRGAVGCHQALGVDDRKIALAGCRAEPFDRFVGLANRWPEGGWGLGIAEIVLHVDNEDGGPFSGRNP